MLAEAPLILLASDNDRLAGELTEALDQHGFRVQRASLRALDRLQQQSPPALIVLDTGVPPYARAELVRSVRWATEPAPPPIIGLCSRESLREVAALEGIWLCLAKPIDVDSLVSAVDRITRYTAEQHLSLAELVAAGAGRP